jgi:hypothetical protein
MRIDPAASELFRPPGTDRKEGHDRTGAAGLRGELTVLSWFSANAAPPLLNTSGWAGRSYRLTAAELPLPVVTWTLALALPAIP